MRRSGIRNPLLTSPLRRRRCGAGYPPPSNVWAGMAFQRPRPAGRRDRVKSLTNRTISISAASSVSGCNHCATMRLLVVEYEAAPVAAGLAEGP